LSLSARNHRLSVVFFLAGIVICLLGSILYVNHGILTYTLDDPYIHLVMARSIAAGHYGYNPTEFSSPSSSILWPFLLVPFVWAGIGTIAPALINSIVLLLTAYLLHRWLTDEMGASGLAASVITLAIVLGCNLVNMVFVGMEHSLQILLGFLVCRGIARLESNQRPPGWAFWLSVIAGPLVRYEMLAVSGVAIVFAFWRTRRFALPALAALCIALTVGGFSVFLVSKGLWWLPSSVIAKSEYLEKSKGINLWILFTNFLGNAGSQPGTLMAALTALSVAGAVRRPAKTSYAVIAMVWLLAELTWGQIGWFRRYELWAVTSICFIAIPAWAPIGEWSRSLKPVPLVAAAICVMVAATPYLLLLERTPAAANNIYNQQYQMGLLVQRLGVRSIAVNDIGAVAWMNPGVYLFDIVGLASADVLQHKRCCRDDAKWLEETAGRHGVEAILVYDAWLPERPVAWNKIAELRVIQRLAAGDMTVSIYSPNRDAAGLAHRLAGLASMLPAATGFTPLSTADAGSQ